MRQIGIQNRPIFPKDGKGRGGFRQPSSLLFLILCRKGVQALIFLLAERCFQGIPFTQLVLAVLAKKLLPGVQKIGMNHPRSAQ